MRYIRIVFLIIVFLFNASINNVYAESQYALPYPSAMPGSRFYLLEQIQEKLLGFWYFGDFGQFKYNLRYTDKYLVEAKTLFEYKQYLLATRSLKKSNLYWERIPDSLARARFRKKDTSQKQALYLEASGKHVEALGMLKKQVPKEFLWRPEKEKPQLLELHKLIDESIRLRQKI